MPRTALARAAGLVAVIPKRPVLERVFAVLPSGPDACRLASPTRAEADACLFTGKVPADEDTPPAAVRNSGVPRTSGEFPPLSPMPASSPSAVAARTTNAERVRERTVLPLRGVAGGMGTSAEGFGDTETGAGTRGEAGSGRSADVRVPWSASTSRGKSGRSGSRARANSASSGLTSTSSGLIGSCSSSEGSSSSTNKPSLFFGSVGRRLERSSNRRSSRAHGSTPFHTIQPVRNGRKEPRSVVAHTGFQSREATPTAGQ